MATPADPSSSVQFTVSADGSPLPGTWQVTKIQIEKEVNKIPQCELEVILDACSNGDADIVNSSQFEPGTEIEVKAGYDAKSQEVIYSGIVMKQNLSQQGRENVTVRVSCKDKAVAMTLKRYSWNFDPNTSDQEVMQKSISKWGVSPKVSSTSGTIPQPVKFNATDWDFVLDRAEVNGMVVIVESGTVNVQPPSQTVGSTVKVVLNDDVFEFDADINAENQFQKIEATAWDVKSQKVVTASYTPADSGAGDLTTSKLANVLDVDYYQLQAGGFLTQQELETWVKGVGVNTEYRKMQGSMELQGSSNLVVGGQLELDKFEDRFNGKVYLSGITHTIEDGNWVTKCTLGLPGIDSSNVGKTSGEGGSRSGGTSGQLPAVQGLQIGKVKKINEDPDGNFRVQVEIPMMDSSTKEIWARFSTFYASKSIGALFYPETGDEVVVGYFGNDPRYPVVLGSMYSSSLAPPDSPDEQNNLKEIVTREKMKLSFDEEKKVITITTPGDNKMIFSDEGKSITIQDQNSNKIELGTSGIEINSPKQVKITGTQGVSINGMKIDLKGDQAISGKAPQISLNADMQLEAKSSAQASFQGGAMCEVKGTLVKIN